MENILLCKFNREKYRENFYNLEIYVNIFMSFFVENK
ncbi:hypothetical protein C820_000570 [Clostridium sp. MD294]|nr:hypothetical protein C820_000570 [Clostridium sp. MD294]